jgi:hypothetical protein
MLDFNTKARFFHKLCAPVLVFLPQAIGKYHADYRCHKFKALPHFLLTIFAQLEKIESANALLEELNDPTSTGTDRDLRAMVNFDRLEWGEPLQLNQSSFSRANKTRSYRLWQECFHKLLSQVKKRCNSRQLEGLGRIVAVDGTFLDSLARMAWAVYRRDCQKLKGHYFFDLAGLPDKLVLTDGKGSERAVLSANLRAGVTYLLDRGYNSYELFHSIMVEAKAHFVTRLLSNATFEVVVNHPVTARQTFKGILSDQTIRLGQPGQSPDVVLRLVVYQNSKGEKWSYITSRFDLEPYVIVQLYGYRWEIERFFWWIKTHLQIKHWYSLSENGVLIQLYAALITFLLLKYLASTVESANWSAMRSDFVRWVARHLFDRVAPTEIADYLTQFQIAATQLII